MITCIDPKNFGKKEACKKCHAFFNESANKENQKTMFYNKAKSKVSAFKDKFNVSPNIFYLGINEMRGLNELGRNTRSFYGRHIIPVRRNDWFEAGHTDQDTSFYTDPPDDLPGFYVFTLSIYIES